MGLTQVGDGVNCIWELLGPVKDWDTVPQWLTAFVALFAFIAARVSISSQRQIARKRAAIDFFLKTEMDRDTLESHKKYLKALDELDRAIERYGVLTDRFMSVGILRKVFDNDVCMDFWAGEMERAYKRAISVIEYVQSRAGQEGTYIEMLKIARR